MEKRSSIIGGAILIVTGTLFLLVRLFPEVATQIDFTRHWPLIVVAVGGLFLISALAGSPPLALPGSIIAGIGGILYYQNLTGNWASWAFAWALIPGFVGVGTLLMGLLNRQMRFGVREGGRLIVISLILFVIFGAFFGGLGTLGGYWPVLLILIGAWILFRSRRNQRW